MTLWFGICLPCLELDGRCLPFVDPKFRSISGIARLVPGSSIFQLMLLMLSFRWDLDKASILCLSTGSRHYFNKLLSTFCTHNDHQHVWRTNGKIATGTSGLLDEI